MLAEKSAIYKRRLLSLDALRGLDMLLIMGLGPLVVCICSAFGAGNCALAQQFRHVAWNGLRLEDTIFPLFLFLAGVSWPFSCAAQLARERTRGQIVVRCLRRAAVLFVLGLVYNGLLSGVLRMGSVLGRIGVAWLVGALLYLFCRRRTLAVLALGIPLAYWMLLWLVPAPDALTIAFPETPDYVAACGRGPFSIVGNLSGYVDRNFMPGTLFPYGGIMDNQSALGYIPAVATALFGVLAGDFLRRTQTTLSGARQLAVLVAAAAGLVALGCLVARGFGEASMPINKKLWSASFTFVVGGYSVFLLAVFHAVVDVGGFVRWTFPLRIIGMNAIAIYLIQKFVPFSEVSKRLLGGVASLLPEAWGAVLLAFGYVALCWLLLYFLHKKGVYVKV